MRFSHLFCVDITERIIAFGFPAEGREAVFRNPMSECKR